MKHLLPVLLIALTAACGAAGGYGPPAGASSVPTITPAGTQAAPNATLAPKTQPPADYYGY